jgi:ketosteroid isomerase-like protein
VLVARLEHPVLVEVGQERAPAQLDRRLQLAGRQARVEGRHVGLAAQADAVAARDQGVLGGRPQGAPQRPSGAAQRRASARVEHIRPEPRRHRAPWMLARMQCQPPQQRPRSAAGGGVDRPPVDLGLELAQEPHSQHPGKRTPVVRIVSRVLDGTVTAARHRQPMSTTTPTSSFDAGVLRRAFENHDPAGLLALYADDATIELADARNTPSRPLRLEGREAIRAHLEDVLARDMTHAVDVVAVGEDAVGYSLRCAYPDGTRVLCAATAQLRDGRIVREVGVQVWDAGN